MEMLEKLVHATTITNSTKAHKFVSYLWYSCLRVFLVLILDVARGA